MENLTSFLYHPSSTKAVSIQPVTQARNLSVIFWQWQWERMPRGIIILSIFFEMGNWYSHKFYCDRFKMSNVIFVSFQRAERLSHPSNKIWNCCWSTSCFSSHTQTRESSSLLSLLYSCILYMLLLLHFYTICMFVYMYAHMCMCLLNWSFPQAKSYSYLSPRLHHTVSDIW